MKADLQNCCNPSLLTLDDSLESILSWANQKYGLEEFITAQQEFFVKMGKVFDDEDFYNERMTYFQDFFLFERPCSENFSNGKLLTPYYAYVEENKIASPQVFLEKIRHSIFQIVKSEINYLVVQDLLNDDKLVIEARPAESFHGIEKKDIIQGFIYFVQSKWHISRGMIIHPRSSRSVIKKVLRKTISQREHNENECLSKLAHTHLKYLRHRHIDPKKIYNLNLS